MRNQDTVGANKGLSTNVTVLTTSTQLVPDTTNTVRRSVTLVNRDEANTIYVAYGVGVTSASTANASLQPSESITLNINTAVYAIATGGSVSVDVFTEEDQ